MKLNIKILLLVLVCICYSCSKQPTPFLIDNGIRFSYINSLGEDLLDPEVENSFVIKDIKMFYMVNGKLTRAVLSRSDNPYMFSIYYSNTEGRNVISLLASTNVDEYNQSITVLKLSASDSDTILCTMNDDYSSVISNVRYNGKLVMPNQVDNDYAIIVK